MTQFMDPTSSMPGMPGSAFFEIDNALLRTEAKKPKHLAKRYFEPRSLETATLKRAMLLQKKKDKLRSHLHHVQGVYESQKQGHLVHTQQKLEQLVMAMQLAETNRQAKVLAKQHHTRHHHQVVAWKVQQLQQHHHEKKLRQHHGLLAKMKTSELRRSHLRRLSKSVWLDTAVHPYLHHVVFIQSWFRYHRLRTWARPLRLLKLDTLANRSFTKAAAYLQRKKVIHVTHAFLKLVIRSCQALFAEHQGTASPTDTKWKNEVASLASLGGASMARMFLTVFMITAHTNEIVEDPSGELEKQLILSAHSVVDHFTSLLHYRPSPSLSMTPFLLNFVQAWLHFSTHFDSYKKKDMHVVLTSLVAHALELARLLKHVAEHPNANEEFRPNVMKQWKVLHQRILEVGGAPAWQACKEALCQEHLEAILDEEAHEGTLASTPPAPPAHVMAHASVLSSSSTSSSSPPSSSSTATPTASPTPPPPRAVEQLLQNHVLAHEIIMDPTFALKPATPDSLQHQVKAIAKHAFKDHIQQAWENQQLEFVVDLVMEIQTSLISMSQSEAVKQGLKDALDVERVKKQVEVGQVDIQGLLKSIVHWMLRLAAPVRDTEIRSILTAASVPDAVLQIHAMLETMHLDLANYYISQLRPHLQTRAVEYETSQFASMLETTPSQLPHTRAWLHHSVAQWFAAMQSRNPENVLPPPPPPTPTTSSSSSSSSSSSTTTTNTAALVVVGPKFEDLYHDAVVHLLVHPPTQWPETCELDRARCEAWHREVVALVHVATLLLLTKPSVASTDTPLQPRLLALFRAHRAPSVAEVSAVLASVPAAFTLTKPVHELPVYNIVVRRVVALLKQGCVQPVPLATWGSYGLGGVAAECQRLSDQVRVFAHHNKAVHATWYDAMLKELVHAAVEQQSQQLSTQ